MNFYYFVRFVFKYLNNRVCCAFALYIYTGLHTTFQTLSTFSIGRKALEHNDAKKKKAKEENDDKAEKKAEKKANKKADAVQAEEKTEAKSLASQD